MFYKSPACKFYALLFIFSLSFSFVYTVGKKSAAASSPRSLVSIEEAYIRSDMVFLGIPFSNNGRTQTYKIMELFKTLPQFKDIEEIETNWGYEFYGEVERDMPQVIYGNIVEYNEKPELSVIKSYTKPEVSAYFKHIKNEQSGDAFSLVFKGQAVELNNKIISKGSRKYISSEAIFFVKEIASNKMNYDIGDSKYMNVNVNSECADLIDVGQEYLLQVKERTIVSKGKPEKVIYELICSSRNLLNFDEVGILRKLSQPH